MGRNKGKKGPSGKAARAPSQRDLRPSQRELEGFREKLDPKSSEALKSLMEGIRQRDELRAEIRKQEELRAANAPTQIPESELMKLAFQSLDQEAVAQKKTPLAWDKIEVVPDQHANDEAAEMQQARESSAFGPEHPHKRKQGNVQAAPAHRSKPDEKSVGTRLEDHDWSGQEWLRVEIEPHLQAIHNAQDAHAQWSNPSHLTPEQRQLLENLRHEDNLPSLNLRHLNRHQALEKLTQFIALHYAARRPYVRVITGKGIESKPAPVIKPAVVEWLFRQQDIFRNWVPEFDAYHEWGSLLIELKRSRLHHP